MATTDPIAETLKQQKALHEKLASFDEDSLLKRLQDGLKSDAVQDWLAEAVRIGQVLPGSPVTNHIASIANIFSGYEANLDVRRQQVQQERAAKAE